MIIAFLLLLTTGCSAHNDIYIVWNGGKARISGAKSKVNVTTDKGGLVRMSVKGKHKGLRIHLSGKGEGQFIFTPIDDSEVILEGLTLHCDTSYAIVFKGKSTASITLSDGSTNTLSDEGIKTKGNLCISGYGMLDITCTANGHKGMRIGGNLYIYGSPKLCVTTSGNPEKMEEMKRNLGEELKKMDKELKRKIEGNGKKMGEEPQKKMEEEQRKNNGEEPKEKKEEEQDSGKKKI